MPPIILLLQTGLPLRPVVAGDVPGGVGAGLRAGGARHRTAGPAGGKAARAVYTALAAASPAGEPALQPGPGPEGPPGGQPAGDGGHPLLAGGGGWGFCWRRCFSGLLRRQAKQTVAIAAAREAMHQQAVATQQRSLTELRTLHAAHRENLEALDTLLAEGQTEAALDKVRALTRQESQAARRYADNPVADVSLAEAARRCGEAGGGAEHPGNAAPGLHAAPGGPGPACCTIF